MVGFATGGERLSAGELVAGQPHIAFINAAFSYWRLNELNRFNGPGRGAWYAALALQTCLAEVSFHMLRELERVNDFSATVDYAEMFASFAGRFVDLRKISSAAPCLDPEPAVGYPAGNTLANEVIAKGHNGIIYPSVRHKRGTPCCALSSRSTVGQAGKSSSIEVEWRAKASGDRHHELSADNRSLGSGSV